jgi:iron complex transport system substrate-binding protein
MKADTGRPASPEREGCSLSFRRARLWAIGLATAAAYAAAPQRIVSVSPVVTEILYGVGAFDKVVAVTEYCVYPPQAKALPKVGGWATPSIERVVSFRPDLVAFSEAQAPFLENQLKQLGIATVMIPSQTVRDAFTAIAALGRATGHERQASELAAQTRSALDAVRNRAARLPHPTVLIVIDRTPGTLREIYAALPGGFLAELAEIAGARVVPGEVSNGAYGKVSAEAVLAANPDIILDVMASPENANDPHPEAAWRELPELNAVRNGRVHIVRDSFVPHDSQMIAKTAVAFARLIHPEVPAGEWEAH